MVDLVEEGLTRPSASALEDSGMVARVLRPYAMVICASPAYLARHGTPRTPADLARHECLDFMQWTRHMRWRLSGRKRRDGVTPESRFRSNNGQALRMAALHGFGIVMQAEILLAGDIAAGGWCRCWPTTCRRRAPCTCCIRATAIPRRS
jgi:DNA-binding transcriptional LysR family regulator